LLQRCPVERCSVGAEGELPLAVDALAFEDLLSVEILGLERPVAATRNRNLTVVGVQHRTAGGRHLGDHEGNGL